MESRKGANTALALSIIATVISLTVLGVASISPGPRGPMGSRGETGPAGPLGPPRKGLTPTTKRLTVIMCEGEIVQEAMVNEETDETRPVSEERGGEEELIEEFHRWEPSVMVVKKGDMVELTVVNTGKHAHSLVIPDYGIDTKRIPGRFEQPIVTKRTVVVAFNADMAGVFEFRCGIPFNHEAGDCDPDHKRIVGSLIVLDT